jgi:hypothetical protein
MIPLDTTGCVSALRSDLVRLEILTGAERLDFVNCYPG